MKVKKSELKQIIQEELEAVLDEDQWKASKMRPPEGWKGTKTDREKASRRAVVARNTPWGAQGYWRQREEEPQGLDPSTTPPPLPPDVPLGPGELDPRAAFYTTKSKDTGKDNFSPDSPEEYEKKPQARSAGGTWDPVQAKEKTEKAQRATAAELGRSPGLDPRMRPFDRSDPSTWEKAPTEKQRQSIKTSAMAGKDNFSPDSPEEYEKKLQARSIGFEEGLIKQMVQEELEAVLAERNR